MNSLEVMEKIKEAEKNKLLSLKPEIREQIEIKEIIYLGKIKDRDIYRLAEQDNRDNYSSTIYKYFDENANLKGIKNQRPDGELEWMPNEDEPEWEELKDEIDKNEAELEEELEQIMEELGIEKEDIESITKLDKIKVKDEKEETEEETEEEKDEKDQDEDKNKEEEEDEELEIGQTTKYNDYEQKISTNETIDQKGTTIKKGLGLDYEELLFVHSYKLNEIKGEDGKTLNPTTKGIAALGIKEVNGKRVITKIPETELQYYKGMNEQSVRFDDNGEVEKNSNTMERFIVPGTNKGLAFEKSEGQNKVYYQGGIDYGDNTAVMGRVRDNTTGWMETETKEIFNSNHGKYKQEEINEEMKMHEEDKGEKIERENADGDLNTVAEHVHEIDENSKIVYEGKMMSVQEVAELPRFKVSPEYFAELYNKKAKAFEGKEEIDMDKVYNEIEDDVNDEMQDGQKR